MKIKEAIKEFIYDITYTDRMTEGELLVLLEYSRECWQQAQPSMPISIRRELHEEGLRALRRAARAWYAGDRHVWVWCYRTLMYRTPSAGREITRIESADFEEQNPSVAFGQIRAQMIWILS